MEGHPEGPDRLDVRAKRTLSLARDEEKRKADSGIAGRIVGAGTNGGSLFLELNRSPTPNTNTAVKWRFDPTDGQDREGTLATFTGDPRHWLICAQDDSLYTKIKTDISRNKTGIRLFLPPTPSPIICSS